MNQTSQSITELSSSTLPTSYQTNQPITEISSSTLLTTNQTNQPITEISSSTLLTTYQTSQVTSQRLIVSTNNSLVGASGNGEVNIVRIG